PDCRLAARSRIGNRKLSRNGLRGDWAQAVFRSTIFSHADFARWRKRALRLRLAGRRRVLRFRRESLVLATIPPGEGLGTAGPAQNTAWYNKSNSMSPLRISAISFLNTVPLMWDFENGDTAGALKPHFEFSYTIPSQCAEDLQSGSADIGIIPAAAYTTSPSLVIIPEVAIAAKRQVRSILLISKGPVEKIRSVAIDHSSRTSTALLKVFLKKFVGIDPGFTA